MPAGGAGSCGGRHRLVCRPAFDPLLTGLMCQPAVAGTDSSAGRRGLVWRPARARVAAGTGSFAGRAQVPAGMGSCAGRYGLELLAGIKCRFCVQAAMMSLSINNDVCPKKDDLCKMPQDLNFFILLSAILFSTSFATFRAYF